MTWLEASSDLALARTARTISACSTRARTRGQGVTAFPLCDFGNVLIEARELFTNTFDRAAAGIGSAVLGLAGTGYIHLSLITVRPDKSSQFVGLSP